MDEMKLRPAPDPSGVISDLVENTTINRRQFMRLGFNTAGGVLAASLGALGFAAILLPPSGAGGGDASAHATEARPNGEHDPSAGSEGRKRAEGTRCKAGNAGGRATETAHQSTATHRAIRIHAEARRAHGQH